MYLPIHYVVHKCLEPSLPAISGAHIGIADERPAQALT